MSILGISGEDLVVIVIAALILIYLSKKIRQPEPEEDEQPLSQPKGERDGQF